MHTTSSVHNLSKILNMKVYLQLIEGILNSRKSSTQAVLCMKVKAFVQVRPTKLFSQFA